MFEALTNWPNSKQTTEKSNEKDIDELKNLFSPKYVDHSSKGKYYQLNLFYKLDVI